MFKIKQIQPDLDDINKYILYIKYVNGQKQKTQ